MNPLFLSLPSHTKHMPCLLSPSPHILPLHYHPMLCNSLLLCYSPLFVTACLLNYLVPFSIISQRICIPLCPPYPFSNPLRPYQKLELHRASIHDRRRLSYELTSSCASRFLFLGQVNCIAHMLQHGGVLTICQLYCSLTLQWFPASCKDVPATVMYLCTHKCALRPKWHQLHYVCMYIHMYVCMYVCI